MIASAHPRLIALLLLPALISFSVQGSLEVLHPIEESRSDIAAHAHGSADPGVREGTPVGMARVHPPHYCPHSNSLAHIGAASVTFVSRIQRTHAEPVRLTSPFRPVTTIAARGPPVHGIV
jgi:hypothetical protein